MQTNAMKIEWELKRERHPDLVTVVHPTQCSRHRSNYVFAFFASKFEFCKQQTHFISFNWESIILRNIQFTWNANWLRHCSSVDNAFRWPWLGSINSLSWSFLCVQICYYGLVRLIQSLVSMFVCIYNWNLMSSWTLIVTLEENCSESCVQNCSGRWENFEDKCYKWSEDDKTWLDAETICRHHYFKFIKGSN